MTNISLQVVFHYRDVQKVGNRFWIITNKAEFQNMLNILSDIDMVIHPEIKAFPCIYELQNKKGFLEVEEVSQVFFEQVIQENKNTLQANIDQYSKVFNKKVLIL